MEMRPKSSATVVVVFPGTCDRSSTPAAASVMTASVVRGSISEMLATVVVFPTANPPATTIFMGRGGRRWRPAASAFRSGDSSETIENPPDGVDAVRALFVGDMDAEIAVPGQISYQDSHHPKVQRQLGADLRDRLGDPAQRDDVPALEVQDSPVHVTVVGGDDLGFRRDRLLGPDHVARGQHEGPQAKSRIGDVRDIPPLRR